MVVCALLLCAGKPLFAASGLVMENPTTLKFTVQDNRVYLRNLDQYDST